MMECRNQRRIRNQNTYQHWRCAQTGVSGVGIFGDIGDCRVDDRLLGRKRKIKNILGWPNCDDLNFRM